MFRHMALACFAAMVLASAAIAAPAVPVLADLGGVMNGDTDDTLAFTPDGATVFFDRSIGDAKTVMVSHRIRGRWTPAVVASFSGKWYDQNPVVSPDGRYLLFNSDRPTHPGAAPLVHSYFGKPGPGANLWKVPRVGDHWGEPVWLGPVINDDLFIDSPSVARDGSVYFLRKDKGAIHIFRSQFKAGAYLPAERVALGDPVETTHDPAIAPDESFIVYDYGKVKGGLGRLCISFREGDHWTAPLDLGDEVNKDLPWSPHLGADHRTVYVTGSTHSWSLSLEPWLTARPAS